MSPDHDLDVIERNCIGGPEDHVPWDKFSKMICAATKELRELRAGAAQFSLLYERANLDDLDQYFAEEAKRLRAIPADRDGASLRNCAAELRHLRAERESLKRALFLKEGSA